MVAKKIVWLKNKNWLVVTRKTDSEKTEISDILKNEKFLNSKLELKNKNIDVWSKITTINNEKYEIKENIAAILEDNEDSYTWSQDLSSILNYDNKKYLPNSLDSEYKENTISSVQTTEDNKEEDDLEIPAFLRRQRN